jgi:hypothetical protein
MLDVYQTMHMLACSWQDRFAACAKDDTLNPSWQSQDIIKMGEMEMHSQEGRSTAIYESEHWTAIRN